MKVFISQPMRGLSDDQIKAHREEVIEKINVMFRGNAEIIDSFFEGESEPDNPLELLGKSISMLNNVDAIYMCEGWQKARGCTIEHECAKKYGKSIIYEVSEYENATQNKYVELEETVIPMLSVDYKARFIAEYWQTKIRYTNLHNMIVAYTAGTLEFKPNCPMELLNEQAANMGRYLFSLEVRAQVEGINLGI